MGKKWILLIAVVCLFLLALNAYYYRWFQGVTEEQAINVLSWVLALGLGLPPVIGGLYVIYLGFIRGERIFRPNGDEK